MTDAINYAILDAVEQDAGGRREPRIGEIYATAKVDGTKELTLDGKVYSRAAWPLVESRFMSPHPKVGPFSQAAGTISGDGTFNQYAKTAYNRITDTLVVMYLMHNGYAFARSKNRGASWETLAPSSLLETVATPIIDIKYSTYSNCLLVVRLTSTGGFSIERSTDDGTTWARVHSGSMSAASGNYVQGDSYERSARGNLVETDDAWLFVTTNPANNSSVVVHRSVDNGLTWTSHTVATGLNRIAVPRIFKANGRYVIVVRHNDAVSYTSVFTTALDLTDVKTAINTAGTHPPISYHRYHLLQVGEDIFGFYGVAQANDFTLYRYDLAYGTIRTSQIKTNTVSSTNPIFAKFNNVDAVVLSGGYDAAGESYYNLFTHVRDYRVLRQIVEPNVAFSTTFTPQQAGLSASTVPDLGHELISGGNGLVFLRSYGKLYVSQATYEGDFQVPQITGSGYMQGSSPSEVYASTLTQVMKGAL